MTLEDKFNMKPSCEFKIRKGLKNVPALKDPIAYGSIKINVIGVTDAQIADIVDFIKDMCR